MKSNSQTTLLTTVNASYRSRFDARQLAHAIEQGDVTSGQVSSFFTEVSVEAQKSFAQNMGIADTTLMKTAAKFASWSGNQSPRSHNILRHNKRKDVQLELRPFRHVIRQI